MKKKGITYRLVLSNSITPGSNTIQLLPFGPVKSQKGDFLVDNVSVNEIMEAFNNRTNDIVIDYEHQTLYGGVAPAAGWIKNVENRGKDGLWAEVEWTNKAKDFIANKEYKYLSPVVFVRKSDKRALYLHSAALTNDPAIDGMIPIANKLNLEDDDEEVSENMEFMKQLAVKLGLDENATEEQIMQKLGELMQNAGTTVSANKEVLSLLDLKDDAKLEDVKGKIIALKNPSGYVSVEDFNKLKQTLEMKDRDELVKLALTGGKITPAQKEWADMYALKDPTGFKNFIDKAPQVVPLGQVVNNDTPKVTVPDECQVSVNKMLGITDEQFKKANKEE